MVFDSNSVSSSQITNSEIMPPYEFLTDDKISSSEKRQLRLYKRTLIRIVPSTRNTERRCPGCGHVH